MRETTPGAPPGEGGRHPPAGALALLGAAAGVWLWSLAPDAGGLEVHSDLSPLIGRHPENLDPFLALLSGEDAARLRAALAEGEGGLEARLTGPDGTSADVRLAWRVEPGADGG